MYFFYVAWCQFVPVAYEQKWSVQLEVCFHLKTNHVPRISSSLVPLTGQQGWSHMSRTAKQTGHRPGLAIDPLTFG